MLLGVVTQAYASPGVCHGLVSAILSSEGNDTGLDMVVATSINHGSHFHECSSQFQVLETCNLKCQPHNKDSPEVC